MTNKSRPKTIEDLFRANALDVTACAHIAVDVQKIYCSEREAQHITGTLAPAFKEQAIDTFWVYMKDFGGSLHDGVGGTTGDQLIGKEDLSSFEGTKLDKKLQEKGITTLLVSGYDFSACVHETVLDALHKKYNVVVMKDATNYIASDRSKALEARGAIMAQSWDVLDKIRRPRGPRNPS